VNKRPAKVIMVQGTASSVGKSTLAAALCRILRQDGWNVAPFKAQNMSLNSFVTADGGEMGRAQVVQAEAACVEPTVDMNPILLKPEGHSRSQVIVHGVPVSTLEAVDYFKRKDTMWPSVAESLDRLRAEYDVVVIEGAGSPAEVNLKARDIVNMRVALYCNAPVLLVADIDRGGVFASAVGTLDLLEPEERALVKAIVINKFRGDLSLLTSGLTWIEERTGVPVAGVLPYYTDIRIPEEDSVALEKRRSMKEKTDYVIDIAVIALPHISNFDDFDPLEQEAGVRLRYVEEDDALGTPDLIILPGTKTTMAALEYLKRRGLDREVVAAALRGTPVIGVCGGYQILGQTLLDPEHVESTQAYADGLGLLQVSTTFLAEKTTHQVRGSVLAGQGLLASAAGLSITGYEIHMGRTVDEGVVSPFRIDERSRTQCDEFDGCVDGTGNVLGTYMHGLFHNEELRRSILTTLAARKGVTLPLDGPVVSREAEYDKLAELVRSTLDMGLIYKALETQGPTAASPGLEL
jgi:adenosylcobyric acid synthase